MNFPSLRSVYYKPSNKYTYGRKERQRLAILEAKETKAKETLRNRPILDLSVKELEKLLHTLP